MSIRQKMQDQNAELDVRRQLEQAIEQFCSRMKLKADGREDTFQIIACELDDSRLSSSSRSSMGTPGRISACTNSR